MRWFYASRKAAFCALSPALRARQELNVSCFNTLTQIETGRNSQNIKQLLKPCRGNRKGFQISNTSPAQWL